MLLYKAKKKLITFLMLKQKKEMSVMSEEQANGNEIENKNSEKKVENSEKVLKNSKKILKDSEKKHENDKIKSESIIKKVFKIIGRVLIWSMIIVTIIIFIRAFVYKKYDVLGYRFFIIMSGSMEPTIDTTDVVITKEQNGDLQNGDIIAFQNSNAVTVHRIVDIVIEDEEVLYQTKGDNNNTVDLKKVKLSEVKGKVVFKISKLGKAILFINSHIVIFVSIIAFIIIIILVRRLM